MQSFIILVLSCLSVMAADTNDLRVVSATRTNASGVISIKEIFTRGGHTNLVRNTSVKDGLVQIRIHRFYHDGSLVGMLTALPDSSSSTSIADSPYSFDLEYGVSNQLRYVVMGGKDGILVDAFSCTNGLLFPVQASEIQNSAHYGAEAKELIDARKESPEHFKQKLGQTIDKIENK